MIIVITQLVQQKPDFVGAAPGRADESQPGRHFHLTVCDCFEEPALELAAIHRAFPVNPASAITAQSRARLREFGGTGGVRDTDGQADCLQPGGVIAGLELDILKEGAIAAEAARKAKTFKTGRAG
jgi:hypothetical protein